MSVEDMQQRAQGRVWSGEDALQQRLIDALGGVSRAVAIAKHAAGIGEQLPPASTTRRMPRLFRCAFVIIACTWTEVRAGCMAV